MKFPMQWKGPEWLVLWHEGLLVLISPSHVCRCPHVAAWVHSGVCWMPLLKLTWRVWCVGLRDKIESYSFHTTYVHYWCLNGNGTEPLITTVNITISDSGRNDTVYSRASIPCSTKKLVGEKSENSKYCPVNKHIGHLWSSAWSTFQSPLLKKRWKSTV